MGIVKEIGKAATSAASAGSKAVGKTKFGQKYSTKVGNTKVGQAYQRMSNSQTGSKSIKFRKRK